MGYTVKYGDKSLSPFTGMTRESWRAAGKYLLKGLFENLSGVDDPPLAKRTEMKVTYPHLQDPPGAQEAQRRAEIFEGLTRTLFIASVLLADEPDLVIGNIPLKEYYKLHILRACAEPQSDEYAGSYEDMKALTGDPDPFRPYQQTVETCALVIGLAMCEEVLWDSFSQQEKDAVAAFLSGYAHANTVPQNWRLFNMLDLAFLGRHGYDIDENIMLEHAQAILAWYAGQGWYRDGQCFDYYSCWAFNFYAPLWNRWYGYEHLPQIASAFEKNSNELMRTYAGIFDRDGWVNMWGRSCIYRNAATSAFDGNLFLRDSVLANNERRLGWVRRICSGALLQFLSRDDLLAGGVPSLGFYGQFTPLVQGYSCAESPFWLGKAFLCLHLPADHLFWRAVENEGEWEMWGPGEVHETVLDGPGLVFTNHPANGETILRSAKVMKAPDDLHGMWNYAKLEYNTKYPWDSSDARQYVLLDRLGEKEERANAVFYAGVRDGVLYRKAYFGFRREVETHWMQAAVLADLPVPYGILRADRLRLFKRPTTVTLGSYGFPDNGTQIRRLSRDGAQAVVLTGQDACGRPRQMAMTIWNGFTELEIVHSEGTNPDSRCSIIIRARGEMQRQYDASEPCVFLSQVITREDGVDFSEDEIFPIREIGGDVAENPGIYGTLRLVMRDGSKYVFDYNDIEGRLTL
ncbi:MAG: DUF2264 domain-containing protein [Lachnospiraceae bacterium]|nr:DUF2264 domain-containing protein [Lachnospiraceae bacterium]